jgi:acyl-CoA thioesterase FadM
VNTNGFKTHVGLSYCRSPKIQTDHTSEKTLRIRFKYLVKARLRDQLYCRARAIAVKPRRRLMRSAIRMQERLCSEALISMMKVRPPAGVE